AWSAKGLYSLSTSEKRGMTFGNYFQPTHQLGNYFQIFQTPNRLEISLNIDKQQLTNPLALAS
ncbi:hypothetical protein N9N41_06480, partial [Opitutales bacterium]|nr:hypothetical protein [Opitutales bacterium]